MIETKTETLEITPEGIEAAIQSLMDTRPDADFESESMPRYTAEGYVQQILMAIRLKRTAPLPPFE